MNVLFLTTGRFKSIRQHGLYPDLLRAFVKHGHAVYVVSPRQRREGLPTELVEEDGTKHLLVKIGNLTKTNLIEKGISTLLIERQYKTAIKQYFSGASFDLVLYSTPPITLASLVAFIKKRDGAKTYLLLKDIFPQNAVDIGLMQKSGIKGLLYKYFRKKEMQLYALSDRIGCMSPANVSYVRSHNPKVDPNTVEVCPNSIEVVDARLDQPMREAIRKKYGIPLDKTVFIYGGNLGKPQGIPFLIDCLTSQLNREDVYFFIVGDGTEFYKLKQFFDTFAPKNMQLRNRLPKPDYDKLVGAADVGMIFLDRRFTIPNFPSRLLAYLQAGLAVLACTDIHTDVGKVIVDGGFGWWCESKDVQEFEHLVNAACKSDLKRLGDVGYQYLQAHYSVEDCYQIITNGM